MLVGSLEAGSVRSSPMAINWTDVFLGASGVGTLVLAGATTLMVRGTRVLARKTAALATETSNMVLATKDVVTETQRVAIATENLVTEAQTDRELAWSPYLTVTVIESRISLQQPPVGFSQKVTIANVGKGWAVHCCYIAIHSGNDNFWCMSRLDAIGGDTTICDLVVPAVQDKRPPTEVLELGAHDDGRTDPPWSALFCEDVFGNRLRFVVGRWGRDVWSPGKPNPPRWAVDPVLWSPS